jgi:hypothetical protein
VNSEPKEDLMPAAASRAEPVPALSAATGGVGSDTQNRRVFVAYPWKVYPNPGNYKKAFTDLEKPLAVTFVFAEQRISTGTILEKIIEMIRESAFGIYDVTAWNPNVTLEYGIARGLGVPAFIAFNPEKTDMGDVPTDVRGYDRLQYGDFTELSEKVATLVGQQLGTAPRQEDPIQSDRRRLLAVVNDNPGKMVGELADLTDFSVDYVQLLLRRSTNELRTTGKTKGQRYFPRPH